MKTKKEVQKLLFNGDFGNHINVDNLIKLIEELVNEALKEGTVVGIKKAKETVGVMGLGLNELLNEYESELRGIKMHV